MIEPRLPFTPVVMIPPTERTDTDQAALALVHSVYRDVMQTMDTARSRQKVIGISEIGSDCERCTIRKLAGQETDEVPEKGWKAQIGTFGHSALEEHFRQTRPMPTSGDHRNIFQLAPATDADPHYVPEQDLRLMKYKWLDLGGHVDMFIRGETFGLVLDWKFQGPTTLKKSGAGKVSSTYHVQGNSYGLALELTGELVTHFVLFALPRDGDLNDAKPVLMRYDRQVALNALDRIRRWIDIAEVDGWDRLIERAPKAAGCFDCRRYASAEQSDWIRDLTSK